MSGSILTFGTQWLGQLPDDWSQMRARYLFRERKQKSSPDDTHLTPSQKYAVLPQSEYMKLTGNRVVLNLTGSDNMKHVESGDFVIHLRSFQGGIEYSQYTGKVSNAYTVLQPKETVVPDFFRHVLKSYGFISELSKTTDQLRDGQSIKFSQLDLLEFPLPSPEIQQKIADFLDTETAQIDDLIAKQERLLELLEEKRRATITHAVTRVNNSVEERIRDICSLNPKCVYSFEDSEEVNFYPMESIGDDGSVNHNETRSYADVKSGYTVFQNGDILTAKVTPCFENYKGAYITNISSNTGFGTTELFVLRAKSKVDPEYLYWITQSKNFNDYLAGGMRGTGGLKRVVPEEFKNYKVKLPTIDEQREIVAGLKNKLDRYLQLKQKIQIQIDLLRERRTSLITAAVTGKVKIT